MQIANTSLNNNYQYKKGFGAKQIDTLNLLKKMDNDVYTPIKATFSELSINNKNDIKFMSKLKEKWDGKTQFGNRIFRHFLNKAEDSRFFVTEVIENGKKRVTNLMEIEPPKPKDYGNVTQLKYIQSAPDIANKTSRSPIKGSGETAIYELVKMSEKENRDGIYLTSAADRFYEKLGFDDMGSCDDERTFRLGSNKFKSFLDKIAQKYNLR